MSPKAIPPLVYLKRELGFKLGEFMDLSDEDKAWYKQAAIHEMKFLGIPIAES